MADVYRWRLAPDGLATRRQLRALGLRPGGQDPVVEIQRLRRHKPPLVAYLYRVGYCIPRSLGMCVPCHDLPQL
ncbi:hypothetical protein OG473_10160 [Streptomyces anulatus]|uniref:hypothetical protein n=1 Tax=Streptomyces anulatus TaxID=1892 RepID=UPI0032524509